MTHEIKYLETLITQSNMIMKLLVINIVLLGSLGFTLVLWIFQLKSYIKVLKINNKLIYQFHLLVQDFNKKK